MYKTRYRVSHTLATGGTTLSILAPDDDQVKIERMILELQVSNNDVDSGGAYYGIMLHVAPNGNSVISAQDPSTQGDLGVVPEQEIWRYTGRMDQPAPTLNKDNISHMINKDFKTSRTLQPGDILRFSTIGTVASAMLINGIITLVVRDR